MASVSETGHAKNVANFKNLTIICEDLGAAYQPSAAALQLPALQAMHAGAQAHLEQLNKNKAVLSGLVAEKEAEFKPLSKLITRVINNFGSCGATRQEVKKATTVAQKITGAAKPVKIKDADGKIKTISQSQLSEDMRIKNLEELIEMLAANSLYNPGEEDLKTTALQTRAAKLRNLVTKVDTASIPVTKAMELRNTALYQEETGIVDTAKNLKKYLLSSLGSSSAIYKKVKALNFRSR